MSGCVSLYVADDGDNLTEHNRNHRACCNVDYIDDLGGTFVVTTVSGLQVSGRRT